MEKIYLAALQMSPGIGGASVKAMVNYFGSAQNAWTAAGDDLIASQTLKEAVCDSFLKFRQKTDVERFAAELREKDIKLCSLAEEAYPELLRNIFNPPAVLYYRGTLPPGNKLIAIVGSRQASPYGKNAARLFASGLAEQGVFVVSGAARGIDTAAHQGALGKTVAVLGTGIDIAYPPENENLLKTIAEQGAVISEYAPGTLPIPGHFPMRNRIISGMSRGVIIVEAGEKSGALITADYAAEEGRDVFAVPGNIFSGQSAGPHKLIKEGAKLVNSLFDVLEEYGWGQHTAKKKDPPNKAVAELGGAEKIVYGLLDTEKPLSMEEIVLKSNLPANKVAFILLQFGLNGLASEIEGRCYIRRHVLGGK